MFRLFVNNHRHRIFMSPIMIFSHLSTNMYLLLGLFCSVIFLSYTDQLITQHIHEQIVINPLNPIVQTKSGLVQGGTGTSRLGRQFHYFKGIPYAASPTGNLRFKAPIKPKPWKHIRPATEHGPVCVERNELFEVNSPIRGSEDCLSINIYTPEVLSIHKLNTLKPVMVFIHYGGLFTGTANSDYLGPEYLMDRDVVLVTFNYRLGLFGFLTTGDDSSPGNYAFKDQVMALKWVKDNIINFGGDSERVTIFGQSGGAGSVHHHILSPASKGLFHAAITESGSALNLWAHPGNGSLLHELVTKNLATFVGCNPNVTSQKIVDCLRSKDAYELQGAIDKFRYFQMEPLNVFTPALEIQTEKNPEPFITKFPLQIISERSFNNVPWINGVVKDEGILRSSPLLRNSTLAQILNQNFHTFGLNMFGVALSVLPDKVQETWMKIIQFFHVENGVDLNNPTSVQGFTDLYTDRAFKFGSYQGALAHALNGHKPIWFYEFDYKGLLSYGDKFALTNENINFDWGTAHCDDLLYLFKSPALFQRELDGTDCIMIDIMTDLWTNFATYHDPTPENVVMVQGLKWEPTKDISGQNAANNSDLYYLNITGRYGGEITLGMANNFHPERMSFWSSLGLLENFPSIS